MKLNNKKSKFRKKIELLGLAFVLYIIAIGLTFWSWMACNPTDTKYSTLIWTIRTICLISLFAGAIAILIAINHLRKWEGIEKNDLQK